MADVGEVTVRVVEEVAPGLTVRLCEPSSPVQLAGTSSWRESVEGPQATLSLLVTEAVKFALLPAESHWLCEGNRVTLGVPRMQAIGPKATLTTAPVASTDVGVMVTPASGSE